MIKRNQQKRQREESSKKISEDKPAKRAKKTDEHREDDKSTKTESHGKHDQKDEKLPVKEDAILLNNAEETVEPDENANESEMDEDPEEDPEEETEMQDTSPQDGQAKEAKVPSLLLPLKIYFILGFLCTQLCLKFGVYWSNLARTLWVYISFSRYV